jgi:hypothetical protein
MMNATKSVTRDTMRQRLLKLLGEKSFCRTTEEFGLTEGGLWISNESSLPNGHMIYSEISYTVEDNVQALLDECGWYIEPYDMGTLMVWPGN